MSTPAKTNQTWRFGVFEVDTQRAELRRGGAPVKLRDQSFRILIHLVEHAGEIVTREELRKVLWPRGTFVDFDHSLNTAMMKLRDRLGDSTDAPIYIETIPKRGYRFVAPVARLDAMRDPAEPEVPPDPAAPPGTPLKPRSSLADLTHPRPLEDWPDRAPPENTGLLSLSALPQSRGNRSPALRSMGRPLLWAAVLHAAIATLYLGLLYRHLHAADKVWISDIAPPEKAVFLSNPDDGSPPALSPDGRRLVFVAQKGAGSQMLWLRELSQSGAQPIPGTDGATLPFWSPNGRSVGYFAGGKIRQLDVENGSTQILADAPYGRGAAWNRDDIIFAPSITQPLFRLSAASGSVAPLTSLDKSRQEYSQRWPQFLPDGRHFLYFTASSLPEDEGTYISALDQKTPTLLLRGVSNSLYASGYLLFIAQGTLWARPFDLQHLRFSGTAQVLRTGIADALGAWNGIFSASNNGVLAYYSGGTQRALPIDLVDRNGQVLETLPEPGQTPTVSPDGRFIALATSGGLNGDLWVYDIARRFVTRVTSSTDRTTEPTRSAARTPAPIGGEPFPTGRKDYPIWSPDGKAILFSWNRNPEFGMYETTADGTEPTHPVLVTPGLDQVASSWSRDGKYIAYQRSEQNKPGAGSSIWILPLFADRKPHSLVQGDFNASKPQISPDGRWLAYVSDESGKAEVYVTSFPGATGKWRVSPNGGDCPRWRGDSRELFFVTAENRLTAATLQVASGTLKVGDLQSLFEVHPPLGAGDNFYDVMPDGQHFVIASGESQTGTHFTLVVNWPALLEHK